MEAVSFNCRARVWNKGSKVYTTKFKGDIVTIAPGAFVEMDWYDAVDFRGQYIPVIKNDSGQYLTEQKLVLEKVPGSETTTSGGYMNPLTGKSFATIDELQADMNMHKHKFLQVTDEKAASKTDALEKKIEALESALSEFLAKTAKPKGRGGRPRKVANATDGDNGLGKEHS